MQKSDKPKNLICDDEKLVRSGVTLSSLTEELDTLIQSYPESPYSKLGTLTISENVGLDLFSNNNLKNSQENKNIIMQVIPDTNIKGLVQTLKVEKVPTLIETIRTRLKEILPKEKLDEGEKYGETIIEDAKKTKAKNSRNKEYEPYINKEIIEQAMAAKIARDLEDPIYDFYLFLLHCVNYEYNHCGMKKEIKKLFPHKPCLADVEQGNLGNCHLLTALISIINKDPQIIMDCFFNKNDVSQDNTIKLRFYQVKVMEKPISGGNGNQRKYVFRKDKQITIEVENSVSFSDMGSTGAPWVKVVEKAFAEYLSEGTNIISQIKDGKWTQYIGEKIIDKGGRPWDIALTGGNSELAVCAISGANTSTESLDDLKTRLSTNRGRDKKIKNSDGRKKLEYEQNRIKKGATAAEEREEYFKYFKSKFDEGRGMNAGFEVENPELGIYTGHAYAIKGVYSTKRGERKVDLINPWHGDEIITISFDQFIECEPSFTKIKFEEKPASFFCTIF